MHDVESTYYQASIAALSHRTPAKLEQRPALAQHMEAEVCVIGAGYAGLATALGLLERGVKNVVILEAEQVGFGASGRNGGFVFGGFSLDNRDLLKQCGRQHARAMYQLTRDAVKLIRRRTTQFQHDFQIDCQRNDSGVLLANWFDDERILRRTRDFMLREFEVDWRLLSREETRAQLHTERYFGALHEANAFHFHPLLYAQASALAIERAGGKIFETSRVLAIEAQGAAHRVVTKRGSVTAQHVVVACGGYIEKLVPRLSRAVLPIATYVAATEPLGDKLNMAMQTSAAVYDTRFAFDYYRPLADQRLLWGGRISIVERSPEQVKRLLYADMLKVYPQLADVKLEFAWSGLMSYARHKMPQLGQTPEGIWYALGFGGHGVAPTTLAGEVMAQAIAYKKALPAGFDQYGLSGTYSYAGLMAAQFSYWYFELRDWWRQ